MDVYIDLAAHVICSFAVGYFTWKCYFPKKRSYLFPSLIAAFTSGLLIDLDHLIDYFMAYGWHFNIFLFMANEQFKYSHHIYLFFHAFEYVIILLIMFSFVKNKKMRMLLLSLMLSMVIHLIIDMSFFTIPPQFYFISYRIANEFRVIH